MTMLHEAGRRRRVFFYVQHLLGIGHLVRASRIAEALVAADFDVTLVTGGTPVEGFPPPGVHHVTLPTVLASKTGFSALVDDDGNPVDPAFEEKRTTMLLDAFRAAAPDVVITEAFPFGRRQMRFELLPLLDAIDAAEPKPLLLTSIRDILQTNRKPGRDEETVMLVEDHFDGILVHGDANFVKLDDTFPLVEEIAGKLHYTGLVAPKKPEPSEDRFEVIVSAGGGAVGAGLIAAALQAQRIIDDQKRWLVITGPNLPVEDFEELAQAASDKVTLIRFTPDFPRLLAAAELSISQAGYNTVCDLLQTGCRPVFVPFASGGETEQTVRAEKLADLGLAEVVPEATLSGPVLADAIRRALALDTGAALPVSVEGAARTAEIIATLLDNPRDASHDAA